MHKPLITFRDRNSLTPLTSMQKGKSITLSSSSSPASELNLSLVSFSIIAKVPVENACFSLSYNVTYIRIYPEKTP